MTDLSSMTHIDGNFLNFVICVLIIESIVIASSGNTKLNIKNRRDKFPILSYGTRICLFKVIITKLLTLRQNMFEATSVKPPRVSWLWTLQQLCFHSNTGICFEMQEMRFLKIVVFWRVATCHPMRLAITDLEAEMMNLRDISCIYIICPLKIPSTLFQ